VEREEVGGGAKVRGKGDEGPRRAEASGEMGREEETWGGRGRGKNERKGE